MNLNHDPDNHLLDQIDKLLETHQPTNNQVLDELATTRPTPRPAFQNELEQSLLARFDSIKQGETPMVNATAYMPIPAPRRNWLPLTLLVALIVVAIAGVMLINGRGKSTTPNEIALAAATATMTPQSTFTPYATVAIVPPENPYVRIPGVGSVAPVVIAVRDIPRGTVLSSRWLGLVYSGDDISQMYTDPELLRGLVVKQDIPRWQPILRSNVTDQLEPTADPQPTRSNVGIHPPTDRVAIAVPLNSLTTDSLVPGVGGSVDIVALLPFKSADQNVNTIPATAMPDGSQLVETLLIHDTLVLFHDQWPQTNAADKPATITFAVSPQDSRMLAWLAEQPQVTFRLQKPLNNVFELPADTRIIDIPFENITADENIQPGDKVDVYSTCALVPDVMGINNTVVSSKTDCSQTAKDLRAAKATVFDGEIVVNGQQPVMTYQSIALAVAPDKVPLFTQLLDAKMHFKLAKSTAASQSAAPSNPTPSLTAQSMPTAAPIPVTPTPDAEKILMTIPRGKFIEVSNVSEGKTADILFSFFYLSRPDNDPTAPLKPSSQIMPVATKVDVIKIGGPNKDDEITLSVTHQQSIIINWALDSILMLSLTNTKVVDIPLNLIDSTHDPIQTGDSIDVYSTCLPVANSPSLKVDCTQAVERKDFVGTVILLNGSLDQNGIVASGTISVAVPPLPADIQLRLSSMIADGMHFKLVKSGVISQPSLTPTPVPQPTDPLGKISFDLPRANIQPLAEGIRVLTDSYVDVIISFKQTAITGAAPEQFQQYIKTESASTQITQRIVHAAHVIAAGDVLTLAVAPQEEKALQWALDARFPITLRPIDPANTFVTPTYTLNLSLDSISHWASDNLEVGDTVDVVAGLVLGNGQNLNLAFKPYGEYYWNDPLSRGLITAQTYSPANTASPSGAIFLRRLVQNATVTAMRFDIDPASGRVQNIIVTLEIQSDTAVTQGDTLKGYIDAGMPYLILKHWSTP